VDGPAKHGLRAVASLAVLAGIVLVYHRFLHVNPTTVALTLLLYVLVLAAAWGLRIAVLASLVATACLNYFFLPPYYTFTIADPQNWVSLLAFLTTAIVASQLSERAREAARQAQRREQELSRLYRFSQEMLVHSDLLRLAERIPAAVQDAFGAGSVGLLLAAEDRAFHCGSGHSGPGISDQQLREAVKAGTTALDENAGTALIPLRLGVRELGSLGIAGNLPSRETLDALGTLIAIAMERAGAVETLAHSEAARESEKLRSTLLDSVTHEFRTPLTAIKASVTSLLSQAGLVANERQELLDIINEEADRLNRLVGEATVMARLDAREVELEIAPRRLREVVQAAVSEAQSRLRGNRIEIDVPAQLPPAAIDFARIRDVLTHLIENAAKYSPEGSAIGIRATTSNGELIVSVEDEGPGIAKAEQELVFDKFYRGVSERYEVQGTGMGLAIVKAIVETHGGKVSLRSEPGHGSVFSFSVPAAQPVSQS
jgi:two-component system sensor histidine kinase KdpD